MLADLRTYTIRLEYLQEFLALVEHEVIPIQIEHLGRLVGYFTSETGTLSQVVHLWAFADAADRERRRANLYADPRFQALGKRMSHMVVAQESKLLRPTAFSPLQQP